MAYILFSHTLVVANRDAADAILLLGLTLMFRLHMALINRAEVGPQGHEVKCDAKKTQFCSLNRGSSAADGWICLRPFYSETHMGWHTEPEYLNGSLLSTTTFFAF